MQKRSKVWTIKGLSLFASLISGPKAFAEPTLLDKPLCDAERKIARCETVIEDDGQKKFVKDLFGKEYVIKIDKDDPKKKSPDLVGHLIDQCLLEMLACGDTVGIATALTKATQPQDDDSLPTALPPTQQFFLGHAYYRLFAETRSKVLQCAYASRSRAQLRDYLTQAKHHADESGNLLSLDLSKVKGAINMLKVLDQPNDCPDAPLTLGEIVSVVREFTGQHIKIAFTSAGTGTDTVRTKVKKIYDLIQSYMSAVAEVETAVQLLDVEILANNNKLKSIADNILRSIYCPGTTECPSVSKTFKDQKLVAIALPKGIAPKRLIDAQAANRNVYKPGASEIAEVEAGIKQIIGRAYACHVEYDEAACKATDDKSGTVSKAYEKLRLQLTSDTYFWAEQAARQDQVLRGLLAGKNSFNSLINKLGERAPVDSPMDVVREMQKSFETQFGETYCPDYRLWYCCKAYPKNPYCQASQGGNP